jgi:hypothetical protein
VSTQQNLQINKLLLLLQLLLPLLLLLHRILSHPPCVTAVQLSPARAEAGGCGVGGVVTSCVITHSITLSWVHALHLSASAFPQGGAQGVF